MPYFSWSQNYSYKADHTTLLFGLSSAGSGSTIMTFAATEAEGEDVTGTPEIVDLRSGKSISFEKLETFPFDANVSWIHEGQEAVFESVNGIYQVSIDNANPTPKRVVAGPTHGLAFSPSESKMAYWKMGKGTTSLVVREVSSGKVLHSWELPLSYGSEPSGFDLAFVGEDRLYARTFDRPDATPLKEFDLQSGKAKRIISDCLALTGADGALYYLAGDGVKGEIYKFDQGVATRISAAPSYTGIRGIGKQWIILTGTRMSGVLDLRTKQVTNQTRCEEVTMIEMSTAIYKRGDRLSTDPALCNLHSPKPQAH